ncbi:MAG: RluA family pseudouridine synthase [Victivallaceae bacterium]|nr:RluA family pseudouridine synthase [Victivallaceae bacterium]
MNFADKLAHRILYSHVLPSEEGVTLLDYLTGHYSRWDADGWFRQIAEGRLRVNDIPLSDPETRLARHDCVAYYPPETVEPEADLSFRIVYEDADLLVIDKPGNLCVHPTGPFFRHTLWHLVGSAYAEVHFINRLDRETSGLLVAARNARVAAKMLRNSGAMYKEYLALVYGDFRQIVRARGVLTDDRKSRIGKKRRFFPEDVAPAGGEFVDTQLVPERSVPPDMTLVRAILHTGRQHQIRATLFSLGFPIVGDKLYGPDERLYLKIRSCSLTEADHALLRMDHQALHSAKIQFPHPNSGTLLTFESPCRFPLLEGTVL